MKSTAKCNPLRATTGAVALGFVIAACGNSPADTDQTVAAGGGTGAMEAVYEAVQGLEGTERYDKLLELAEAEGGSVSFYHAAGMDPVNEAFTKKTGIKVLDFKATSERVAERVSSENTAGEQNADLVKVSVDDMNGLLNVDAIAPLESPAVEAVPKGFKAEKVVSPYGIMFLPAYNTGKLSAVTVPQSLEEFLGDFEGRKAIELTDWFWYEALVEQYFMEQKGMTEQAAMDLMAEGLKGASIVDGHTLIATLLAAGQYDYVPNVMVQYTTMLEEKGAPISDEGLSEDMPPQIVQMVAGIPEGAKHPASGLLFLEFMLSPEGQKAFADMDYVPTAGSFKGQTLLETYPNTILIDSPAEPRSAEDLKLWKDRWDQLLQSIGGTVLKEPAT